MKAEWVKRCARVRVYLREADLSKDTVDPRTPTLSLFNLDDLDKETSYREGIDFRNSDCDMVIQIVKKKDEKKDPTQDDKKDDDKKQDPNKQKEQPEPDPKKKKEDEQKEPKPEDEEKNKPHDPGKPPEAPGEHDPNKQLTPEQRRELLKKLEEFDKILKKLKAARKAARPKVKKDW